MSKYFWLCKLNKQKHEKAQPQGFWQCLFRSRSAVNLLFLVIAIVLGSLYLFQVNRTATSGFAVKDLNTQITELKESHQKLELQVADLQSLQQIQSATKRLELIARTKLEYVQTTTGAVALEK